MWECKRCGDCCKFIAEKNEWKYADINKDQKEIIKKFIQPNDRGCEALAKINNKYTCLNQMLYGLDAKPLGCQTFTDIRCHMTVKIKNLLEARSD